MGQPDRLLHGERRALAQQGAHLRLPAPLLVRECPHQVPHDGKLALRPHSYGQPRDQEAVRVEVDDHGPTPRASVRHPGALDPSQVRLDPCLDCSTR